MILEAKMPDLLIRNIPDELKRDIEKRAKSDGRSLSEQAKRLIAKGLESDKPTQNAGEMMLDIFRDCKLTDEEHNEIWGAIEHERKSDAPPREIPFSE